MDIEELSKSQIILLTLLVSFVTSIATGIVTVSLMDQAPPAIAQTVNRVIERTVEKVVPSAEGQAAAVVTTEKTVIVKESDLIVQAVEKMKKSLVRVQTTADEPVFIALGIVLDDSGTILTDTASLGSLKTVEVVLPDGSTLNAAVESRDEPNGVARLRPSVPEGTPVSWNPVSVGGDELVLGQTVVALSGRTILRIADGLIVAFIPKEQSRGTIIDTNIASDVLVSGSPLMNADGAFLGVSTVVSRASSPRGFVSASWLVSTNSETASE